MFSDRKKSRKKNKKTDLAKEQNRISKGTVFSGDIESEGSFRIEGVLKGNLKTTGKVVLSETGKILGDLECNEADIEGVCEGSIVVSESLSLKSTCQIKGDVITGTLLVEPGADLNGTCTMRGAIKTLKNEPEKQSEKRRKTKTA